MIITQRATGGALNFIWTKVSANAPTGQWCTGTAVTQAFLSPRSPCFFPKWKPFLGGLHPGSLEPSSPPLPLEHERRFESEPPPAAGLSLSQK